ncbi:MAG: hypothetical protein COV31_00455 [Candidatus Yanofskybacteria bacterium CG10_big_fil_rev_8_21_14_0_10_46_23]|uniref:Uncharacterized protein n=1 Tax=Candidatus Yanofskybacteria bacterium CG10_big_fil_rev_8_21_14_0_10_46_23 TaxID=1975098 RepID=A0A2H0R4Y1_9BACT|nr:MAG: hypothetical protein COV31_00455 [Candidatus Yanofskybacteria bacterium CG10_big_fil_rev_8_21_14_0_10_46_23]
MNKILATLLFFGLLGFSFFGVALIAQAITPSLSIQNSGGGDSVQVNVSGDAYANVVLYYQSYNYGSQSRSIGTTGPSGHLSTSLSSSFLGVNTGSSVYVVVNGQTSPSVIWPGSSNCFGNNCSGGTITLSQTGINLGINQSRTVSISGGSQPYSLYPSLLGVFQASIGGNTLTIWGQSSGSGSVQICSSGVNAGGSGCATIYVTVDGFNNNASIYLSPSNLNLNVGSNATISISGGNFGYSGNYYISSNSNQNIASTSINGSTINVYGQNSGTTSITVCQSNGGQCTSATITVNSGGFNNYVPTAVTFSQSSLNINSGESRVISIYGGSSSSYNLAYNSNPNALQATVSGSTLSITGRFGVAGVIVVCSTSDSCGAVTVLVNGNNNNNFPPNSGNWTFCVVENQTCYFSGSRQVRYGANNSYFYRTFTGSVFCSNGVFGDPIFGVFKKCEISY